MRTRSKFPSDPRCGCDALTAPLTATCFEVPMEAAQIYEDAGGKRHFDVGIYIGIAIDLPPGATNT